MNEKAERLGRLDSRVDQLSESVDTTTRKIGDITARLSQKGEESDSLTSKIQEGEESMLAIEEVISAKSLVFKKACLSAEKSAKAAEEAQTKAVQDKKWSETCQGQLEEARKKKEKMNSFLDAQKETLNRLENEKKLYEENLISAQEKIHDLQEEFQLKKKELESLLHELLKSNSMSLEGREDRSDSFSSDKTARLSVTDDDDLGISDGSSSSSTDDTQMSTATILLGLNPSLPQVQKLRGGWVTGVSATRRPGVRWYGHSKKCPEGTWKCPDMIKEDLNKGSLGSNTLGGGVSSSNTLTAAVLTSSSSSTVTGSLAAEEAPASSSKDCVPPAIKTSSSIFSVDGSSSRSTCSLSSTPVSSSSESGSPAVWASSSSSFSVGVPPQGRLKTSKTGGSPLGTNPSSRKRPRDEEEEVFGQGFSSTRGPVPLPSSFPPGSVHPGLGLDTRNRKIRKTPKKRVKKSEGKSSGTSVPQFLSDDEEDNCEVPEEDDDPNDPDYHDSDEPESDDNDDLSDLDAS